MLLYRKDIFEKLKLTRFRKTWDDLAELMPTLRRSGMNFYMPLSSQTGTKSLVVYCAVLFSGGDSKRGKPRLLSRGPRMAPASGFNNETGIRAFQDAHGFVSAVRSAK